MGDCNALTFDVAEGKIPDTGNGCLYSSTGSLTNDTDTAVFVLKRRPSSYSRKLTLDFKVLAAAGIWNQTTAMVRDVFGNEDLGVLKGSVTRDVAFHGVSLLIFRGA